MENVDLEKVVYVPHLTIEESKSEYPYIFNTFRWTFMELSDEDIAEMVEIAVGICPHCHERMAMGCQCWNDE